jgi:hypothetical protein
MPTDPRIAVRHQPMAFGVGDEDDFRTIRTEMLGRLPTFQPQARERLARRRVLPVDGAAASRMAVAAPHSAGLGELLDRHDLAAERARAAGSWLRR